VKDGSGRIHAEGSIFATSLDLDNWIRIATAAVECGNGISVR